MTAWHAGMPAVCVRDSWIVADTGEPSVNPPKKGGIYRIAEVHFCSCYSIFALELEGMPGLAWASQGFRPLVDDDQDEQLLDRIKAAQPQRAPAQLEDA